MRRWPLRFWFWFVTAFVVQIAGWTAWIILAAHHPVAEVPVAAIARP